jgi:lipoate-protein ligase A
MTQVERVAGPAAHFHARDLPDDGKRHVWWFDVDGPALVLGSTQTDEVVNRDACERHGVDVVRRRSGGGAVLLWPNEVLWLDVIIGRDDPQWDDDVGRAMWWIGQVWADALGELGVGAPDGSVPQVHRGGLVNTPWSRQVCFAGLGPGEVTLGGQKLVGVSQRRSRGVARFQCAIYRAWRPELMIELLAPPTPTVEDLDVVAVVDKAWDDVIDAVTQRFTGQC